MCVIQGHRGRPVVSTRIAGIEWGVVRNAAVGIQCQCLHDRTRSIRRLVTAINLEIGGNATDDITIGVDSITLQVIPLAIYDIAFVIRLEGASTGIKHGTIIADHEITIATDRQVKAVSRTCDIPLSKLLGDIRSRHSTADRIAPRAEHGRCVKIRELCARSFEAGCADVRDIVSRYVQIRAGRIQAAQRNIKRHSILPMRLITYRRF